MRKITTRILLLFLFSVGWARAQTQPKTFTITATDSPCAVINAGNSSTVGILVSGTWSGTLTPTLQISAAANAPSASTTVTPTGSTTAQATILGSGGTSQGFRSNVGGFTQFSLCPTSFSSGTATVQLYLASPSNVALLGGGGPAYSLPTATSSILGGVKPDGTTITNIGGAIAVANPIPAGVTYAPPSVTPYYWSQTIASGAQNLTAGTPATVTLAAGYVGIDVTTGLYQVLLNDANLEAVTVTGGTYTQASGGTVTFTPFFSHGASASYVIGSASSGLQETVNQACGTNSTTWQNAHCNVIIPAGGPGYPESINTYNVYGTLYWHTFESTLTAGGAVLNCMGRGACLQVGDQISSDDYANNTIRDLTFRPPTAISSLGSAFAGVLVTNTVANGSYKTITTASAHNFRPGDMVTVLFTDDAHYWGDSIVYDCGSGSSAAACTSSSTTFRVAYTYHHRIASDPWRGGSGLCGDTRQCGKHEIRWDHHRQCR